MNIALEAGVRRFDIDPRVPDLQQERQGIIDRLVAKGIAQPIVYIKEPERWGMRQKRKTIGCVIDCDPAYSRTDKLFLFSSGEFAVVSPLNPEDQRTLDDFKIYFRKGMRIFSRVHTDPQKAAEAFSNPASDANLGLPFVIKESRNRSGRIEDPMPFAAAQDLILKSMVYHSRRKKDRNYLQGNWRTGRLPSAVFG